MFGFNLFSTEDLIITGEWEKADTTAKQQILSMSPSIRIDEGYHEYWGWDSWHRSHEVQLSGENHRTAHFHPNWSNGTAGVQATRPLTHSWHYWEIHISNRVFGTSMMFGVGTKASRLHEDAFVNLVGVDDQSWGLSHKGLLWHNGKFRMFTKPFVEDQSTTVGILVDMEAGTLSYFKDGKYLGLAFTNLHKTDRDLYPFVSSTAAKTEMTLGTRKRSFQNLQDRCRFAVLRALQSEEDIDVLPTANKLREFIRSGLY